MSYFEEMYEFLHKTVQECMATEDTDDYMDKIREKTKASRDVVIKFPKYLENYKKEKEKAEKEAKKEEEEKNTKEGENNGKKEESKSSSSK